MLLVFNCAHSEGGSRVPPSLSGSGFQSRGGEAKCEPWGSPRPGGWKWTKICVLWRLRQKVLFVFWRVNSSLSHKSGKELQSDIPFFKGLVRNSAGGAPCWSRCVCSTWRGWMLQKTEEIQVFHWAHPMHNLYIKKRGSSKSLRMQSDHQTGRNETGIKKFEQEEHGRDKPLHRWGHSQKQNVWRVCVKMNIFNINISHRGFQNTY